MVHEIENFFGCYLLYCLNPRYKGRTYIGFTVDPNRRINQHNKGRQAGGACRTSGRGPWEMILIIHGFPNQISALRFEWAWQNPKTSKRLRHVVGKRKKELPYMYRVRVATEMLQVGPWNRLPLTFRWLKQNYLVDFEPHLQPPSHMAIAYGPVKSKKVASPKKKSKADKEDTNQTAEGEGSDMLDLPQRKRVRCAVCLDRLKDEDNMMKCLFPACNMESHTLCLSAKFLSGSDEVIPVEGKCPKCLRTVLWGDLLRYKMGCYKTLVQESAAVSDDEESGGHWADELQTQA